MVSTRIPGRRTAPLSPFLIPTRAPRGFAQDPSTDAHLHAGVDGGADGAAERVPALVIEPGEELGQPVVREVLRRAEVEPWVELVDDQACAIGGSSLVIGGSSLVILEGKACNPL